MQTCKTARQKYREKLLGPKSKWKVIMYDTKNIIHKIKNW